VVQLHGLGVDDGFEGVIPVRQGGQFMCHCFSSTQSSDDWIGVGDSVESVYSPESIINLPRGERMHRTL
jgi:hypothetical protein